MKSDHVLAVFLQNSGDVTGLGIQFQAIRQIVRCECHRPITGHGNREKER